MLYTHLPSSSTLFMLIPIPSLISFSPSSLSTVPSLLYFYPSLPFFLPSIHSSPPPLSSLTSSVRSLCCLLPLPSSLRPQCIQSANLSPAVPNPHPKESVAPLLVYGGGGGVTLAGGRGVGGSNSDDGTDTLVL
jgi:hypothetical protein